MSFGGEDLVNFDVADEFKMFRNKSNVADMFKNNKQRKNDDGKTLKSKGTKEKR